MALQVFINSVDVTAQLMQEYNLENNMTDEPDIYNFAYAKYGAKSLTPAIANEVLVYDDGVRVFGGEIIQVDRMVEGTDYLVYSLTCKDYSHTMDRYLVVEKFENEAVITIMNDIMNRYINRDYIVEVSSFEEGEIWSSGVADLVNYRSGSQGLKISSSNLVTTVSNRSVISDLQPSGFSASTDVVDVDIYVDNVTKLSSLVVRIGDGSTATNYYQYTISGLVTGWNRIRLAKSAATVVGSPSWASISGLQIRVTATASNTVQVTFDNWNVLRSGAFTNNASRDAIQTVNYIAFNYLEPTKCFKKMAELFGWNWYVDPDKDIHFFGIFDEIAPFSLDDGVPPLDGNYLYQSLKLTDKSDQLRNGIFVRGGDYLSAAINDNLSNQVDGSNKIFLLGYKYANYTLTVGGVRKAVGLDNIDAYANNGGVFQNSLGFAALSVGNVAGAGYSQQVIVTKHGNRSAIKLRIRKVGNPVDNFLIQVVSSDASGLPVAPVLSNIASVSGASLTTSFVETTIPVTEATSAALIMDAGFKYNINIGRSGANDAVNYYQIDVASRGQYDGVMSQSGSPIAYNLYFQELINYDVLYNFQEKIITFNVAPTSPSTIIWNGQPYKPVLVYTKDYSSISTYGEFQFRVYDPSIKSLTGAVQRANQELLSWAQAAIEGEFTTYRPGLHAGQTITIESTLRGLPPEDYIIKRVSSKLRTHDACEYNVSILSKKTMNILTYLQRQLINDSNSNLIQDDEILEKIENILETITVSDSISTAQNPELLWSNDAGTTPNRNIWTGGSNYQWQ